MTYFSAPGVIRDALSFERIEDTVCEFYDVDKTHVYDHKRTASLVWPRMVIAYFAIELLQMTLVETGRRMNRDHTTILWSRRQVQNRKHCEQLFSAEVEEIRRRLKAFKFA